MMVYHQLNIYEINYMLDPKYIRDNLEKVKSNTSQRNMNEDIVTEWNEIDMLRNSKIRDLEELNKQKNDIAQKLQDPKFRTQELIALGKELRSQIEPIETELKIIENDWNNLINQIPNIHASNVPIGKSDEENKVVRKVGSIPKFEFEPKDHLQIGKDLDILDFDAGSKVSGSQFYYLKNDAVRLEYALIQYGLEFFTKKGFNLIMTPDVAKSRYYLGTGYAPRGDEQQTYEIVDEDLGLIATSEVTMAGLYADEVLNITPGHPLKYAAISHCFRKEAGAYGKYSKGLYRVHQFSKLEMFVFTTPNESDAIHEQLLALEEEILQSLEISYQVILMCSGDTGAMAARKYDLEAWMPGRNDYGEVTSTSNCTDYQARNLNIKYKKDGKNEFVHMLNGTAIVLSRIPVAILENFQMEDGRVKIPNVLVPYFGKEFIEKKI